MIVLRDRPGQLCNRIWSAAYFVSYCKKHNVKLFAPLHFDEYQQVFEHVGDDNSKFTWVKNRRLNHFMVQFYFWFELFLRKLKKIVGWLGLSWVEGGSLPDNLPEQANKKVVFINSFDVLLENQGADVILDKEYVRAIFKLNSKAEEVIDSDISKIDRTKYCLVGIHLRKKDYQEYRGGLYFFSDEVYKEKMHQIENLLNADNKEVCFIMCSDDKVSDDFYKSFRCVERSSSSMVHDLVALSKCDFILGPPSTFSQWASFYGDVPLSIIESSDSQVKMNDFSPIVNIHAFANGTRFIHHKV